MKDIILTIIIPYYETPELTKTLLNGLRGQLNDKVEVIVVDDGCNEKMLDEFKDCMEIIHLENNIGQCRARKKAIEIAKGKYIAFIDSDDMVTPDYVEILLKAIDEYGTDVINFNWVDLTRNEIYRKPNNPAFWKAIYKSDKLIEFEEDIPWGGEDLPFQQELEKRIANGYTITYLDRVLYLYNWNREGSLTWNFLHKED